ncbi:hypothetical protein IQ06DRAFT_296891 [Phaeosphaeriaceae sp. SRC1lsM3a]|nr:hypothetical protein IQ06DRAFT_296891 [Stagonospora sp. SRC1lsM3a]
MKDLELLKQALRDAAKETSNNKLTEVDYEDGFSLLASPPNNKIYDDFISPKLQETLTPLFASRNKLSVLEIGPGPRTILALLPENIRRKVGRYTACEPNALFAATFERSLAFEMKEACALPGLDNPARVLLRSYESHEDETTYDLVLFCHSLYGMKSKREMIKRSLGSLGNVGGELVVVFHRDGCLKFDGLVSQRTATSLDSFIMILDDDQHLDTFASFIAGIRGSELGQKILSKWRAICRLYASHDPAQPNQVLFHAPEIMVAFNKHAGALHKLTARVPLATVPRNLKNYEARNSTYAAMVAPTSLAQVQDCVSWAVEHDLNLTVIGGSHSGQCVQPNVVAVDMKNFEQVYISNATIVGHNNGASDFPLIIVGAGCTAGEVVRSAMDAGLTVPLGSRPSVGIGLPLQGGMGHLSRQHGLACDSIVGAIMVSVKTGEVFCIGNVPNEHWPPGAIRPDNEDDLLWALKGAGTNFGVVISVVFKACPASKVLVREWVRPLTDDNEAVSIFAEFDDIARKLNKNCSADPCIYVEDDEMRLGVTMYETASEDVTVVVDTASPFDTLFGEPKSIKKVDCMGIFETDMYMSSMHGGHAGGRTSSFKRCVFLKDLWHLPVAQHLLQTIRRRPSSLCYLHLLQGGGAIRDVPQTSTAFGCRNWDYACVITGVWSRDQDNTELARAAIRWVYHTVDALMPLITGVYGADLGPDPRDKALAARAFGRNRPRLARLKSQLDPSNILPYACPLPKSPMEPSLIFLFTGQSGAGKDYCAEAIASILDSNAPRPLKAQVRSISEATKREFAARTGADFGRLINDRGYKEQYRHALTAYYESQVRTRPHLPQEHFLDVVYDAADADVLFITGMRDEAPVATFAPLVPESRVIEIRIQADEDILRQRRGANHVTNNSQLPSSVLAKWHPDLVFTNSETGPRALYQFAKEHILPLLCEDYARLADMVRTIPNFPNKGMQFCHVLGITQEPGGLSLYSSLMQSQDFKHMSNFDAIVCCEAGGIPFAAALAMKFEARLVIVRKGGKVPPPTLSVIRPVSHISSHGSPVGGEGTLEMKCDVVRTGSKVLIVDDVLATGNTLCAMLELLRLAGVDVEDMFVQVIAEFPLHRGRARLLSQGFGRVRVGSLLIYGHV